MESEMTNLCVKIPKPVRKQIQDRQDARGCTVDVYMNWMIETFFRMEDRIMKLEQNEQTDVKTFSFQVPTVMVDPFKEYLRKRHLKQRTFFLDCIQRAIAEDAKDQATEEEQ